MPNVLIRLVRPRRSGVVAPAIARALLFWIFARWTFVHAGKLISSDARLLHDASMHTAMHTQTQKQTDTPRSSEGGRGEERESESKSERDGPAERAVRAHVGDDVKRHALEQIRHLPV